MALSIALVAVKGGVGRTITAVPSSLAARAFEQLAAFVDEKRKADGKLLGFLSMVDRCKPAPRRFDRTTSRAAIAYRDLWIEIQRASLSHIDLTAESDAKPVGSRARR